MQVFAWGDNDHGQQGNGTTSVNRKPSAVLGLEPPPVPSSSATAAPLVSSSWRPNRVACGSSHSVAWRAPSGAGESTSVGFCDFLDDSEYSTLAGSRESAWEGVEGVVKHQPVAYAVARDPLGANGLGIYASEKPVPANTTASPAGCTITCPASSPSSIIAGAATTPTKPSLTRLLLHLDSDAAKQQALEHTLRAVEVHQARVMLVAALAGHAGLLGRGCGDGTAKRIGCKSYASDSKSLKSSSEVINDNRVIIYYCPHKYLLYILYKFIEWRVYSRRLTILA